MHELIGAKYIKILYNTNPMSNIVFEELEYYSTLPQPLPFDSYGVYMLGVNAWIKIDSYIESPHYKDIRNTQLNTNVNNILRANKLHNII